MLIVEGPDGAGKSMLCLALSKTLGWGMAKRVVAKDTTTKISLKQWTEENVARGFHPTIFDRHRLISEPIYGSLMRDHATDGFDEPAWLSTMMHSFYNMKPIIIYCMPSLATVKANIAGDKDNAAIAPYIDPIYRLYNARMAVDLATGRAMRYDYTKGQAELESLLDGVTALIKMRRYSNV